ncbi:hypothetical protein LAY57_05330 [Argonema antarcticum A004/B2]|nr:hypothetical protein [Argonema antarcticum A004/B2]
MTIYFVVLPKLGNTNSSKQIAVLSKVLPLLKNYQKVVLGDREFCSVDLAEWLRSQAETYFCLRLRRNEYIKIASLGWVQLEDLGVIPGISIYFGGVKLTDRIGCDRTPGLKEHILILLLPRAIAPDPRPDRRRSSRWVFRLSVLLYNPQCGHAGGVTWEQL